jgi:transposase-like protein
MESSMAKTDVTEYQQYVVQRTNELYWRVEEKAELVLMGLSKQVPITTLCRINNVSPSLYYEWRELFIARGKEGLFGKDGRSQREINLEKKIHVLERCVGELILEKELLKKLQDE